MFSCTLSWIVEPSPSPEFRVSEFRFRRPGARQPCQESGYLGYWRSMFVFSVVSCLVLSRVPNPKPQAPKPKIQGSGLSHPGLGAWDIACGSSDMRFLDDYHIHILHAMLFCISCFMYWVVLSFGLSRATSPEPRHPKFRTWDLVVRHSEVGTLHVGVGTSDF
jgi:hypothetical protein